MQGSQVSSPRNPRAQQLTVLDINLALGRAEILYDPYYDEFDDSVSMFDLVDDPHCHVPYDVMDELWALEDDNDFFDPQSEPEPEREPSYDPWGFWED